MRDFSALFLVFIDECKNNLNLEGLLLAILLKGGHEKTLIPLLFFFATQYNPCQSKVNKWPDKDLKLRGLSKALGGINRRFNLIEGVFQSGSEND